MKMLPVIVSALALAAGAARAEPLPLPKPPGPGGSCPHGYLSSGSYCVPPQGAQDARPLTAVVQVSVSDDHRSGRDGSSKAHAAPRVEPGVWSP
jgi:hypothetical protein